MTAPALIKQDDVKRIVAGAIAGGLVIKRIRVAPDGTIDIIPESGAANDDGAGDDWEEE